MGTLRNILDDPEFAKASPQAKRLVLEQAGVPSQPGDDLTMLTMRAIALANREDALAGQGGGLTLPGAGPLGQMPAPGSAPPTLGTLAKDVGGALLGGAAHGAPSMLGGMVGRAAGPFLPFVGRLPVPAAAAVGESLGSMAGEWLAQQSGLNPRDTLQVALAGATPAPARRAASALPPMMMTPSRNTLIAGIHTLPGGSAALTEQAGEEIRGIAPRLRARTQAQLGEDTINELFGRAYAANPDIDLPALRGVGATMAERQAKTMPSGQLTGVYKKVLDDIASLSSTERGAMNPHDLAAFHAKLGTMPLENLDYWRQALGALLEHPQQLNSQQKSLLNQAYGAILTDMEAAVATMPGTADLLHGIKMARRNFAADNFEDLLEHVGFGQPRADGLMDVRTGRLLQEFDRMDRGHPSDTLLRFKESLSPEEYRDMRQTIEFWHQNKGVLEPPSGAKYGSGPNVALAAGTYAATGSGELTGLVVAGRTIVARMLTSPQGRAALREMLAAGGGVSLTGLLATGLGQTVRAGGWSTPWETSKRLMEGMRAPGEMRLEAVP